MPRFRRLNIKASKDNGTYVFSNFDIGLYYLDTPRFLGEQLSSLALIGGRNIITEKGALVPQYGHLKLGQIDEGQMIKLVTKDSQSSSSFFIVTAEGNVYLYTAAQGLKKYKTTLEEVNEAVATHRGKDLIIYNDGAAHLFGSYYPEATFEAIVSDITLSDYSSYYQALIPIEHKDYFWNGKELSINGTDHMVVTNCYPSSDGENLVVRMNIVGEHATYSESVTIGEQTLNNISFVYRPEDAEQETTRIEPQLMEISQNRLFIVDVTGRIYYSQIGVIDGFNEAYGAGFFEGFYNSTSKTLSIEDFLNGTLISKEDGIYYLTLESKSIAQSTTSGGQSTVETLAISQMEVSIKKIANIGQEYASDHVIVREEVYAYDTYSGSIVKAAGVNVFGNIIGGETIIDNKALNSMVSGINTTRRFLTFNGQENVFILYYGVNLNKGIILTLNATLFPRELDKSMTYYLSFNQGVVGITAEGEIIQDYKSGTVIEGIPAYADFEPIGLRDNRLCCASILEVTELNGVDYTVTTKNTGTSIQNIKPVFNNVRSGEILPPLIYSDYEYDIISDSYAEQSRWADKKSNLTRIYAPMSGREGVQISIEFPASVSFCLAALRLPDFSQGE